MRANLVAASLCSVLLASCASVAPPPFDHQPEAVAPLPFALARPPVALVLSGGAARGFAHVGVLRVLEENGIRPDLVVGSSAGSVVGALYASGLDASEMESAMSDISKGIFTDLTWPRFGVMPGELGLVRGERFRSFIAARLKHPNIEDFPIRFAAVATDLESGSPVAFNHGDAAYAVRASVAVPGLVTPATIKGRTYADGQIASPVPVQAARRLGARIVIAIDVIYPPEDSVLTNPLRVLFQAFLIGSFRLREFQVREADLVIAPDIRSTSGQYGLGAREELIETGVRAANEALPEIRRLLGMKASTR